MEKGKIFTVAGRNAVNPQYAVDFDAEPVPLSLNGNGVEGLAIGDIVTVDSPPHFSFDPATRRHTKRLQRFVVAA